MDEKKRVIDVKAWKEIDREGNYSGKNATIVLGEHAYRVINEELYNPSFEGIEKVLDAKNGEFKRLFNVLGHRNLKVALKSLIDAIHLHHQFSEGKDDAFLKKAEALLEELFVEVNPFHYGNVKAAMENESDPHALFFGFIEQFRYICSLNFAWVLYWMLFAKEGEKGWSDLFSCSGDDNVFPFLDSGKRQECLQDDSSNIVLFPYGSIFLVQEKGCADNYSKMNFPLKVGRIGADEDDAYMLAPPMIRHLLDGDYYPFSRKEIGLNDDVEEAFFKSNEYFDFFYNTLVPDYIGAGSAVLYGFEEISEKEYLLKHLFQYVDQVAVSVSASDGKDPDEMLKALKAIEADCGRENSKGAISFELFRSESVLGK